VNQLKHIFKGKVLQAQHYMDSRISYFDLELVFSVRSYFTTLEWRVIESNDNIEFPLRAGDYVMVNNTKTCVEETIVNADGSITCLVNIVLDTIFDEEKKGLLQNEVNQLNTKKNKLEKEKEERSKPIAPTSAYLNESQNPWWKFW
jgi:hypothetical protein